MLSPSSLFSKNIIGVLTRNGGGKWNQIIVSSMSLLNMALVSIRVGLGTSHFIICLPPWVWVISFDHSSALCHVTMTSDPLMSNTAKSNVVSLICSREVFLCSLRPPFDSLLVLIHKNITFLYLMLMMWETLWPSFDEVSSCRLQLIIQESDLETPFKYLGACMP